MNKLKQVELKKYPKFEQLLIKVRRLEEQNNILRKKVFELETELNNHKPKYYKGMWY